MQYLTTARNRIIELDDVSLVAQSSIYETTPVDVPQMHLDKMFLNAVIIVHTMCEPETIAAAVQDIENSMGRVRTSDKNVPRIIDIDLLYAGRNVIRTSNLTIPHPHWNERRFVVLPLVEVRPSLILFGDSRSTSEILLALPPSPEVVLFTKDW